MKAVEAVKKAFYSFLFILYLAIAWVGISSNESAAHSLLSVIASVSATLLGFLVTATSILLVLTTRKILENMRRTGHLRVMMDSFFNSGVVFLLSLIGSLASLLMHGCYLIYGTIISIGLLFLAIQLFIIGGYRFYRIISFISSHQAP